MAGTKAIGFFNFAQSYQAAANDLYNKPPHNMRFQHPVMFLYWHAIEMFLKAFLMAHGHTIEDVKWKFGHRINRLYNEARNLGLPELEGVETLATNWDTADIFETRYLKVGYAEVPDLGFMALACQELSQAVWPSVEKSDGGC